MFLHHTSSTPIATPDGHYAVRELVRYPDRFIPKATEGIKQKKDAQHMFSVAVRERQRARKCPSLIAFFGSPVKDERASIS
jgi:hypothetical protein